MPWRKVEHLVRRVTAECTGVTGSYNPVCVSTARRSTNCTGYTCTVWAYRPYQADVSCTPFRGREGDEIDHPEQEAV